MADDVEDVAKQDTTAAPTRIRLAGKRSPVDVALGVWVLALVAMLASAGWLGYSTYRAHQVQRDRAGFAEAAGRGAVAFTSLNYQNPNGDIARVLAMSTGAFHDDFQNRSRQFVADAVRTQTTSVGSVTEAGVETIRGNEAQVLVAVRVKTSRGGSPDAEVHGWRLRITITRVGGDLKLSNIGMVA